MSSLLSFIALYQDFDFLLLSFRFITSCQFVEQFRIHFHECFQHIIDQSDNGLIPMLFANAIQAREHDRHYDRIIFFNQRHGIFIVPEVQCSFSNLQIDMIFNFVHLARVCVSNIYINVLT